MGKGNEEAEQIGFCATELLDACTDDYASRIWDIIGDDVIMDVLECTDGEDGFTRGDVCLAVGRALLSHMGQEI